LVPAADEATEVQYRVPAAERAVQVTPESVDV
jgi:hypothetical protein